MAKSKKIQQKLPSETHNTIFEIKIQLNDVSKPPVHRTVQVASDTNLYLMHGILQGAMGWSNYHMHNFYAPRTGAFYGLPDPEGYSDDEEERTVILSDVLSKEGDYLKYEYDFGDSWEHTLTLKKILTRVPGVEYPQLTGAKGACPPEDCGGSWEYEYLKTVLSNTKHIEYEDRSEWVGLKRGQTWDANAADLAELAKGMRRIYESCIADNGEIKMF